MDADDWEVNYRIFMGMLASGVDCADGESKVQCKEFFDMVEAKSAALPTPKERLASAVGATRYFLSDGKKDYRARWLMHDAIEVLQGNLEEDGVPLSEFGLDKYDPERVVMLARGFDGA